MPQAHRKVCGSVLMWSYVVHWLDVGICVTCGGMGGDVCGQKPETSESMLFCVDVELSGWMWVHVYHMWKDGWGCVWTANQKECCLI